MPTPSNTNLRERRLSAPVERSTATRGVIALLIRYVAARSRIPHPPSQAGGTGSDPVGGGALTGGSSRHHGDRVSIQASVECTSRLGGERLAALFGSTGDCFDDAATESLLVTLGARSSSCGPGQGLHLQPEAPGYRRRRRRALHPRAPEGRIRAIHPRRGHGRCDDGVIVVPIVPISQG